MQKLCLAAAFASLAGVAPSSLAQCGSPHDITIATPNEFAFEFIVNGVSQPRLTFVAGDTYTFTLQNTSFHPFILTTSTTGGFGSSPLPTNMGVSCACSGCASGCSTNRIVWNVPATLSGTFNYRCSNHPGMGNQIDILARPSITDQPDDAEICDGGMIMLSVAASAAGNPSLSYQWRKDGHDITGATFAMLHIMPAGADDAGEYDCVVSNQCVSVTSTAATVSVVQCCPADFNGDMQVDFFDYLDFAVAFDAEDPMADFNGDMQVDFFDYLDFAMAFDAGCE
jgi:hypothetical protein